MILDSSALVAVALKEPEAEPLAGAIDRADLVAVGAPTLAETAIVLSAKLGPGAVAALREYVATVDIAVIEFGEHHWPVAVDAFARFGRGRHPAGLNFGDCLTYAAARLAAEPLLATGNDFARTDLPLVDLAA